MEQISHNINDKKGISKLKTNKETYDAKIFTKMGFLTENKRKKALGHFFVNPTLIGLSFLYLPLHLLVNLQGKEE